MKRSGRFFRGLAGDSRKEFISDYPILTISAVLSGFSGSSVRSGLERSSPRFLSSFMSVSSSIVLSECDERGILSDSLINAINSTAALASA